MPSHNPAAEEPPAAIARAWAATLGVLLLATWPLWTPLRETPRLPPITPLGWVSPAIDFLLLGVLGIQLLGSVWPGAKPACWSILTGSLALVGLMAVDQLRWQPWAYHAALAGLVLATCSARKALLGLRLIAVAVYAYSAIAKLDAEFAATLGSQMLGVLGGDAIGIDQPLRQRLALLLPISELALAIALACSIHRRALAWPVCLAAGAMHATTILVLSPWGLDHSLGVLLWNAGFAWQTVVLFRPQARLEPATSPRKAWLGYAACGLAIVAPLGTPFGWWDQWPGWALYAPGGERATLYVNRSAVGRLPRSLRGYVESTDEPASPWRQVRLEDWVLADTLAPIYPQNRVTAALTLGLIEKAKLNGDWLLVLESPADRFTRKRQRREVRDRDQLNAAASLARAAPNVVWTDRSLSRRR